MSSCASEDVPCCADRVVGGDDGVEGLRLAAGRDGCALNDRGIEMGEGLAVEGSETKKNVQMREGGFLQSERGGTGEMALGEIEEGEGAERFVVDGRDFGGGEEVVRGEVEVDFAVGRAEACRDRRRECCCER